jgi:hypothetical protein
MGYEPYGFVRDHLSALLFIIGGRQVPIISKADEVLDPILSVPEPAHQE